MRANNNGILTRRAPSVNSTVNPYGFNISGWLDVARYHSFLSRDIVVRILLDSLSYCLDYRRRNTSLSLNYKLAYGGLCDLFSIGLAPFELPSNWPKNQRWIQSSLTVIAVIMSSLRRRQSYPRASRTVSDPSESQVIWTNCLSFQ